MRWAVPLVLGMLLLAGCATKAPDPAAAPDANASAANVTAANAQVDDGTRPQASADMGHMPHLHDYWKGRERVTLFDGQLEPDTENATFATFFQVLFGKSASAGGTLFNLPDGQIVYEGSGKMDLTVTWSDPRVTSMGFIYHLHPSASDGDWKEGGELQNGKTFSLPLAPDMTDMPHSKTSKWQWGFGPSQSPGAVLGPFHLKLEVVRTSDIMLFPAHPDFWRGAHQLQLLDVDHHGKQTGYAQRAPQLVTTGNFSFQEDYVHPAKVVPMETAALEFNVTITAATSTPGKVMGFGFFYRGADRTSSVYRCEYKPLNGTLPQTLRWIVPAKMEETDSPYANASAWAFLVEPIVSPSGTGTGADTMGGMTDVEYTYHVTTTAYDNDVGAKACPVNRN